MGFGFGGRPYDVTSESSFVSYLKARLMWRLSLLIKEVLDEVEPSFTLKTQR